MAIRPTDDQDTTTADSSSRQSNIRLRDMEGGIEILDHLEACDIVKNCSIVVGMHPDQVRQSLPSLSSLTPSVTPRQAVEHIIDFALLNNKPFAVVPCCVYHKQFPHRSLSCPFVIPSPSLVL
jgi:hypothetical protein